MAPKTLLPDKPVSDQTWADAIANGPVNPLTGKRYGEKGRKYSEDQERDERGRFGSGGAGSETADNARALGDIAVSAHFSTISEKAQIATAAWMEKNGVTMERMQEQIAGRMGRLEEGAKWYPEARARMDELAARTGIPVERIAAATSALSPRTPWELENGEGNRRYGEDMAQFIADGKDVWPDGSRMSAEDTVLAWKMAYSDKSENLTRDKDTKEMRGVYPASYNDNAADAVDILRGDKTPDEGLTDNKTRSFYDNFMDPESSEVTIDTHMYKAMEQEFGWTKSETEKAFHQGSVKADQAVSSYGYTALAQAMRNVADELGVTPSAVQAAYWLEVQPIPHVK